MSLDCGMKPELPEETHASPPWVWIQVLFPYTVTIETILKRINIKLLEAGDQIIELNKL